MRLKFLAISDTHLGEETSLLCFPQGRWRLWQALRDELGGGGKVSVDELILLGDVPDRTLSSTAQIITQTNAFMATLGNALAVKKLVYLPGNHDHTLWTSYAEARHHQATAITPPSGELLVEAGKRVDEGAAEQLLSIFLGYPLGSAWRALDGLESFDFVAANPLYAQSFGGRTYVFTHGTHFRPDVDAPEKLRDLIDHLQGDQLLGHIEIKSGGDVRDARTLRELERIATPFVDSLWPSSGSNPTSHSDQLWYLLTSISGKFVHKRKPPPDSHLYGWADLGELDDKRIARLTPEHPPAEAPLKLVEKYKNGSIERCRRYFLDKALAHLAEAGVPVDPVTFVYGDTHEGGWGRLPNPRGGGEVRVYNTGAWVVHNADDHPPCHLFAVDYEGNEHLLDVSFAGVQVDQGDKGTLLALAGEDAENKKRTSSKLLRLALKLLPGFR